MFGMSPSKKGYLLENYESKLVLAELPVGVFKATFDEDLRIIYVNEKLVKILKAPSKERLLNKTLKDMYQNEDEVYLHINELKNKKSTSFNDIYLRTCEKDIVNVNLYFNIGEDIYDKDIIYGAVWADDGGKNLHLADDLTIDNKSVLDRGNETESFFDITDDEKRELLNTMSQNIQETIKQNDDIKQEIFNEQNIDTQKDYIKENEEFFSTPIFLDDAFYYAPFGAVIENEKRGRHVVFYNKKLKEMFNVKEEISGYYSFFIKYIFPLVKNCENGEKKLTEDCLEYLIGILNSYETNSVKIRLTDNRIIEQYIYPIIMNDSNIYGRVFYFLDITERISAQEKILEEMQDFKNQSIRDYLTGAYNRRGFEVFLSKYIEISRRHKKPLALLLLDLDGFKDINDAFGHLVGDKILKEFSKLAQSNVRKSDIFARYGGDEFVIIAIETDKNQAIYLAEKLKRAIAGYKFGNAYNISCSFGISVFRIDDTLESFLNRADSLLYKSKSKGKNRVEIDKED